MFTLFNKKEKAIDNIFNQQFCTDWTSLRRSVQQQYCYLAFIKAAANIHKNVRVFNLLKSIDGLGSNIPAFIAA
jgi:hypothetical protein